MYAPYPSMYVRASLTHEHDRTHSRRLTHSLCLIYTDMLSPRHATFTFNNAEGRDGCFWFPTRGSTDCCNEYRVEEDEQGLNEYKDKVSSRLTGRRGGWPFWIPVSREIAVANGPAELP
eukprot:superscaffoldBa00002547_g14609